MIIGDPSAIAIESSITEAYERLGQRALGFFVVHILGNSYGVREADATMLGCSFGAVQDRIAARGTHTATFSAEPNACLIADAFCASIYDMDREHEVFFGMPCAELERNFYDKDIAWAPDGDEAFDDGSYILQFDIDNDVRIIAFRRGDEGNLLDVADLRISADHFYRVLDDWQRVFESEWIAAPKHCSDLDR
jgi:hypothetical protein